MKAARRDTPKKSLPVTPPNIEDQSPSINEHTKADEEPDANGTATKSVERTQKSDLSDQDQGRDDPSKRRRTIAGALDTASSDIPFTRGARRRLTDFNLAASTLRRISITEINETPPQSISSAAPRENIPRPASPGSSIVVATSASAMPESAQLSRAVSESDDLYETAPQGQATQDIFANPSQYVNELSDLLYPTLPNIIEEENEPTRTQEMSENEKEEIQELDRWIESRLETGRATDEEQIIQALSCTSMNPFLADKVLNNLNRGEGIPTNIPGVWTEEDDELHGSANHSDIVKLQEKHGSDNFDIRGRYLETVRQLKYEES